jgi:hypothetical protein
LSNTELILLLKICFVDGVFHRSVYKGYCPVDVKEFADVWAWYQQFSHPPGTAFDREAGNFFIRVEPDDIAEFKNEFGDILHPEYEKFLLEIGAGCLSRDVNSNVADFYYNEFLDLDQMAEILRKETCDWDVYPDFIDENELPFFMVAANSVLVLRTGQDAVFFPYLDMEARSLGDFLRKLMLDTSFHEKTDLH